MRDQVNRHSPGRSKASDGWIGDAKHAANTSDHNPWVKDGTMGIVTALDITHDPKNNVDTYAISEFLRQQRDLRIKYVISNRRIFSSLVQPWQWRTYTGSNPHSLHMHVSVNSTKNHYDNEKEWKLIPHVKMPTADQPISRPILRKGSKGEDVRILQRVLNVYFNSLINQNSAPNIAPLLVDGDFGTLTDKAVRTFQQLNGLLIDGQVGPLTWSMLDRIEQVPTVSGAPLPLEDNEDAEEGE